MVRMSSFSSSPRWRFRLLVATLIAAVGGVIYPVAIHPMMNSDDYKKNQSIGRDGIVQEEIQPGGMKVWSDPFGRK